MMLILFLLALCWILWRLLFQTGNRKARKNQARKKKKKSGLSGDTEKLENRLDAHEKGRYGENQIALILEEYRTGHKREFTRVYKNLYVPYGDGTSEIDLVMIHEKGVFVFESKFYGGWIYGGIRQEYWTQKFPNGEEYLFYNPVRQNNTHIKALAKYLNFSPEYLKYFHSYIIFSDQCELKKVPKNDKIIIMKQSQLARRLSDELKSVKPIFTKQEAREIAEKLKPLTNVSKKIQKEHIEYVQSLRKG